MHDNTWYDKDDGATIKDRLYLTDAKAKIFCEYTNHGHFSRVAFILLLLALSVNES